MWGCDVNHAKDTNHVPKSVVDRHTSPAQSISHSSGAIGAIMSANGGKGCPVVHVAR